MTESELNQYRALITRVVRNRKKIEEIRLRDIQVVDGKVKGSSKYFPYIETNFHVQMYDPKESDRCRKQIQEVEKCIVVDRSRIEDIETFISSITDPELQAIYEMRVYEKMKWVDIAAELDGDRTTYAKKFKKYINNSRDSPISQTAII